MRLWRVLGECKVLLSPPVMRVSSGAKRGKLQSNLPLCINMSGYSLELH